MLLGLFSPSFDKSQRENIFLLSRHIMNDFIKTYPLFIPSLYDEFYVKSHELLNQKASEQSLHVFQQSVSELSLSSVYHNKQQALNASIDKLYNIRIASYQASLKKQGIERTEAQLLGIWQSWRMKVCQPDSNHSLLPLKIELPSDNNLNYYVAFVCQIIEPLFNDLTYYRIIWWRDTQSQQAWCFITEQRIEPTVDLIFLILL